jgi:hypothetical protein
MFRLWGATIHSQILDPAREDVRGRKIDLRAGFAEVQEVVNVFDVTSDLSE